MRKVKVENAGLCTTAVISEYSRNGCGIFLIEDNLYLLEANHCHKMLNMILQDRSILPLKSINGDAIKHLYYGRKSKKPRHPFG